MSNEFGALMTANQRSLLDKPDEVTLRDYFAGQVLASGLMRQSLTDRELDERFGSRGNITREEIIASEAYRMADAMIAERSK